jgi:hypothetical protein
MADTQRRPREGHSAFVQRRGTDQAAQTETAKQKRKAQRQHWQKKWEKASGKKYGISTHKEYTDWLEEQRKKAGK